MKKLIKMLKILPVVNLLKQQKSVIKALRRELDWAEKWVAVADFNHGVAEERAEMFEKMMKTYESHDVTQNKIILKQRKQIENYESMTSNLELLVENRNKMIELLQARLDARGL
jgi:hypothetical protein